MNLFVYGSLLKKGPSHQLIKNCSFISQAILENHILYDLEGLEMAAAVPGENTRGIWGEVYAVPDDRWEDIDNFCGYQPGRPSRSLFFRKSFTLQTIRKEEIQAEAYILPPEALHQFVAVPVPGGRWI